MLDSLEGRKSLTEEDAFVPERYAHTCEVEGCAEEAQDAWYLCGPHTKSLGLRKPPNGVSVVLEEVMVNLYEAGLGTKEIANLIWEREGYSSANSAKATVLIVLHRRGVKMRSSGGRPGASRMRTSSEVMEMWEVALRESLTLGALANKYWSKYNFSSEQAMESLLHARWKKMGIKRPFRKNSISGITPQPKLMSSLFHPRNPD